jgi:type II secretory pathway component PulF
MDSTLQRASEQAPEFSAALTYARNLVKRGHTLASAGQASGLFRTWECGLIAAAEQSGNVPYVLSTMARFYERRSAELRLLRARLAYPAAAMVLALFIVPLPALAQGSISISTYLLRSLGIVLIGYLLGRGITRAWEQQRDRGASRALAALQLAMPWAGYHTRLQNQLDYLIILSMALRAGLPAVEAARAAADSLSNLLLAERYSAIPAKLLSGIGLTDALSQSNALQDDSILPLLYSGEAAGRLDEMICNAAELVQQRLNQWRNNVTDWLPRIIYFMVAAVVAASLL